MKWLPTCREATELASRALEERLPFAKRFSMRLHLAICKNCRLFAEQLNVMRRLFRQASETDDTQPGLAPEARLRIETELQRKLDPGFSAINPPESSGEQRSEF